MISLKGTIFYKRHKVYPTPFMTSYLALYNHFNNIKYGAHYGEIVDEIL